MALARLFDTDLFARAKAWSTSSRHESLAQRAAGAAFLIRFVSAAFLYLSQVFFARWIGESEFGIYVYAWTWVQLLGEVLHLGLSTAAQRYIPRYIQQNAWELLRGFVSRSHWIVLSSATLAGLTAALAIRLGESWLNQHAIWPLYLACMALPAFTLCSLLDGIARSYNWIGLALLPPYVLRPFLMILIMTVVHQFGIGADATTAMMAAVGATWATTFVHLVVLNRRLRGVIPAGPRQYEVRTWLTESFPILLMWGFYTLLSYIDILVLQQFRPPEEVALYYAASKTLALVAFVNFAVGAAVSHRFSEYHVSGDRKRLAELVRSSVRWTFWPALAAMVLVLALGRPFLWLFGPKFVDGYPFMFILAVGLLARAALGPTERLLIMVGQQRACAAVYAAAFGINLALSLILVPRLGGFGVAAATATSLLCESVMLFWLAKDRLGVHTFIWDWTARPSREASAAAR